MLYAVSGLLTALICWPLFGDYLLYRDAVATPRSPLTASAFGIDGMPPRAVPQDGLLALASHVVDGGVLVAGLTTLFVFAAGVGYGRLAARLVPQAGRTGSAAAATVAIWNPFVAERLLQGHWSLLAGYAALGWAVCAVLQRGPSWRRWASVAGVFAVAGLTPTGSVLVAVVAVVTAGAVRASLRSWVIGGLCWLATASPWLVGSFYASGVAESGGASVFALRAEPWLGSLGTAVGLGGIWNDDAVPASRASPWALVATALLVVVIACGSWWLVRHRTRVVGALAMLAAATVVLVVFAATDPGLWCLDALLAHVPGAGLLRDTQKYLALAMPFVAVAAAAAVALLRRWVPAGFALAAVAALVVAPLPDLAWGVGGAIRPVAYPSDYQQVVDLIEDGDGSAVALWPAEQMRSLPWNRGPSLTPLPRMIEAPVVLSGELSVGGETVDPPSGRVAAVTDALKQGGDVRRLADLGVGWVVVESADAPTSLHAVPKVFAGEYLSVYRIPDPATHASPSTAAWVWTSIAHAAWLAALAGGLAAAVAATIGARYTRRQ